MADGKNGAGMFPLRGGHVEGSGRLPGRRWLGVLVVLWSLVGCTSGGTSGDGTIGESDQPTGADLPPMDGAGPTDPTGDAQESTGLVFPEGFLWGVAMSAFQTEGNVQNDWTDWAEAGNAPAVGDACDSWHRWQDDVVLARELGVKVFRLSIEWARVQPAPDRWDLAAIEHYRQVLEAVRQAGMEPMVTLHHFTNPRWVAEEGAWTDRRIVDRFREYADRMAQDLGDLVDLWAPQNESMVYVSGLAMVKAFPGGRLNDVDLLRRTFGNTVFACAAATDALRNGDKVDADGDGRAVEVWMVHAVSPTYPADPDDPATVAAAERYDHFYNRAIVDALVRGALDLDFDGQVTPGKQVSGWQEGDHQELVGRVDVLGLNYYSRLFILSAPGVIPGVDALPCLPGFACGSPGPWAGDNGNEIYPPGLYRVLKDFSGYGLPLAVTENGVADADDHLRPMFLVEHLAQVHRAISEGVDVRAYLHWSLLDNYEWVQGYEMKFGLHAVDFRGPPFTRTPRPSAALFQRIVQSNGLSPDFLPTFSLPGIQPWPGD